MERNPEQEFSSRRGVLLLWTGWAIAPLAWALHLSISYLLVPWVCATESDFLLYLVTGAALLIAAAGVFLNWQIWERLGMRWSDDEEGVSPRSRFMSLVGLLINVLFFFVIVAQGVPVLVLPPCG